MALNTVAFVLFLQLQLSVSHLGSDSGQEGAITIQNGNDIICVSNDNTSPMFVSPPRVQDGVEPLQLLLDLNGIDGWQLKQLEDSVHEPVIDKRWEDFEVRFAESLVYKMKNSVTLSAYNLTETLIVWLDETMERTTLTLSKNETWNHVSVILSGNELRLFRGNSVVRTSWNFRPTNLTIETTNKTYFKIHNYTYLYSEMKSEEPREVPLPPETSCVVAYVSMCPSCYLIMGDKRFNYTEGWQRKQIEFHFAQRSFHVFRGSYSNNETLYWEIDIRQCSTLKNVSAFVQHSTSREPSQCYSLNSYQRIISRSELLQRTKCNAGLLGTDCKIKCEDVLGEERKFCQQSKVCEDGSCYCSWGFKGQNCTEPCNEGEWGTDCRNKCSENGCDLCGRITGECTKVEVNLEPSTVGGISVGLILGLITIGSVVGIIIAGIFLFIIILVRRRSSGQVRSGQEEAENTRRDTKQSQNLI